MTSQDRKQGAFGALVTGLARAFQWRLLLLWTLGLLVPTFVVTLPFAQLLAERLDHSVHVQALATRFDIGWMIEVVSPIFKEAGTALTLEQRGKLFQATVAPMPFVPHRYHRKQGAVA